MKKRALVKKNPQHPVLETAVTLATVIGLIGGFMYAAKKVFS